MNETPDCKTAAEAMAAMTEAIHAVPAEAVGINTSFGRRYESAGGGWYWGVSWVMWVGSGRPSRPPDRSKVLADAFKEALHEMELVEARDA